MNGQLTYQVSVCILLTHFNGVYHYFFTSSIFHVYHSLYIQEMSKQERQRVEELMMENKRLDYQKSELITAFKKQVKLIDILKRQKVGVVQVSTVLVKKRQRNTREHFAKAREECVLTKRSRYSRINVHEVHEMRTTTVAVRMHIGINYTVRELRDNTVANFAIIQSRWV